MKNDYTDIKFKELLDKLQQESWQLELLISGFAIFGLVSFLGPLENLWNQATALESYNRYLYPIAYTACVVLIVNLIIHLVLRGLWIGTIGLRYVSDEIDYDSLNAFKKVYTLKIDDLGINSNFSITKINNQLGFKTIITLKQVPEGETHS